MREHNYLYLIWKDPKSRKNYTVGRLEKSESRYVFEYCNEYKEAHKVGGMMIQAFPEEKRYESEELFPLFTSRLPDKKRKNIEVILEKYGLDHYDGFELLRKSGGRLPIDTFEFIDPIFDDDLEIEREFYIEGIRHSCSCHGKNCEFRPQIEVGMNLNFRLDNTNKYDVCAVQVLNEKKEVLGYIPRYYSQSISERINNGMTYECIVLEANEEGNCQECVKVRLTMPKKTTASIPSLKMM